VFEGLSQVVFRAAWLVGKDGAKDLSRASLRSPKRQLHSTIRHGVHRSALVMPRV